MPRYIDADKIDYTVRSFYDGYSIDGEIILKARAVAFESDIDQIPTADVVPRSEYEKMKEKADRFGYNLKAVLDERAEAKTEEKQNE